MSRLGIALQEKIKTSSSEIFTFTLRLITGLCVGLTLALILQEVIRYGTLSFLIVIFMTLSLFFRVSRGWNWTGVLIFDLVCVLIGLLLRMYILIAPGA